MGTAAVREARSEYGREAELSVIWAGQLFARRSLVSEDGSSVRVVYRGLPGTGPGPDFREAIVVTPEGPRHGDIELHVRASDFRRHGHHLDPAYARVVLHVVFDAEGEVVTPLPGGGLAPVLTLPRRAVSRGWDPARAWAEPCATAIGRLGPEAVASTVERLGDMRFRQKAHALRKCLSAGEHDDELLWGLLLEGLAYGADRERFRRLAVRVSWAALSRELSAVEEGGRVAVVRDVLETAFGETPAGFARPARPGNGPEKRLAAAAALAARFAVNGPAAALLPLAHLSPRVAALALIEALTVARLLGRARAIELVANAVLPLAAALGDEPQAEAIHAVLPLPARYGAVRHLHRALAPLRPGARGQQGMLYLLKTYCTQGGCGRCPLS